MERVMVLTQRITRDQPRPLAEKGRSSRDIRHSQQRGRPEGPPVKAARIISERYFQRRLTPRERRVAGPLMHYGMGTLLGACYGGLAEFTPYATKGFGAPFGAAVWLGADELATPAAGLAPSPTRQPLVTHARALAAHLVYGATVEVTRRGMLRLIAPVRSATHFHEFYRLQETSRRLAY
jgi:hypothetical protein